MTDLYTHISQRAMEEAAHRYEEKKAELLAEAKKRAATQAPATPDRSVN
jgi:hypothetical protein